VIPPDANAAFVASMEDVLEVYQRPHDPEYPVVCLDETSKQLVAETRVPIAAKPGQPARHDYEYARNGTANLFMIFAPLEGWRHVEVTDRHTAVDYAQILKAISDTNFPKAKKIVGHAFGVLASGGSLRDGPGQSQHPPPGITLRSLSRCRGPPPG
jgi:DDE superfamily endonuclease